MAYNVNRNSLENQWMPFTDNRGFKANPRLISQASGVYMDNHMGSKVLDGEILNDANARVIRDGSIIFNGKISSIFREKNQAKQVSAGLECGITLKDFSDFQKKDIIEVYNATITERTI